MVEKNRSSGGRISGQFFPAALGLSGTAVLVLWFLAFLGAAKPTAVHFGDVHNHFHAPPVSPADPPVRSDPPPIVIETPPPNIFISGSTDPKTAGQVVQREMEARQAMVSAAQDELAGELKQAPRLTKQDLLDSYQRGVERIYGPRSQAPADLVYESASVGPTDGWFVSDCEDDPQMVPLSEKFPGIY